MTYSKPQLTRVGRRGGQLLYPDGLRWSVSLNICSASSTPVRTMWFFRKRVELIDLLLPDDQVVMRRVHDRWNALGLRKEAVFQVPEGLLPVASNGLLFFATPIPERGTPWWILAYDIGAYECGLIVNSETAKVHWCCIAFSANISQEQQFEDSEVVAQSFSELIEAFGGIDGFFERLYR